VKDSNATKAKNSATTEGPPPLQPDPIKWKHLVVGVTVLAVAALLQIYVFGVPDLTKVHSLVGSASSKGNDAEASVPSSKGICSAKKLWNAEDLAGYDGSDPTKPVLIGIVGEVFDVSKGAKHYGKGGGYNGFAGKDGSRAFVSGKFTKEGLVPDVVGLKASEVNGLADWLKFYRKDYKKCGKLIGHFYDEKGEATAAYKAFEKEMEKAKQVAAEDEKDKKDWPSCNSRWSQSEGRSLWCTTESGGVKRTWAGKPRQFFVQTSQEKRCVCAPDHMLKDPSLKEYDDCDPTATSCHWDK